MGERSYNPSIFLDLFESPAWVSIRPNKEKVTAVDGWPPDGFRSTFLEFRVAPPCQHLWNGQILPRLKSNKKNGNENNLSRITNKNEMNLNPMSLANFDMILYFPNICSNNKPSSLGV